ncbi:hypothetical protein GCM10027346_21020 [Hymenobacter seoulensis]
MRAFVPSTYVWRTFGFIATTPLVCKRHRSDGLLDVVIREPDGTYTTWIAQADSIWLLHTEPASWPPFPTSKDFEALIASFPEEHLLHVPYAAFTLSPICSAT